MEGEILSNLSIVAAVPKDTEKFHKTLFLFPSSWFGKGGKGARRGMFLVHETDAFFFFLMIAEKKWEKQEVPLGSRKKWLWWESNLGLNPSYAT